MKSGWWDDGGRKMKWGGVGRWGRVGEGVW